MGGRGVGREGGREGRTVKLTQLSSFYFFHSPMSTGLAIRGQGVNGEGGREGGREGGKKGRNA